MTPPIKLDDCFVKPMLNCPFSQNTNLSVIVAFREIVYIICIIPPCIFPYTMLK